MGSNDREAKASIGQSEILNRLPASCPSSEAVWGRDLTRKEDDVSN
jgi:hypothetical protein